LKEYASAMSEAQVAEEVDRIRKAAVRNHTPEVYKLCYSAVDLTTLSCTDSVESVTEFAGKAVKFYQQFPHLPNVASICIYPPPATLVIRISVPSTTTPTVSTNGG
jgi:deoxyribose-phosphate aldolase